MTGRNRKVLHRKNNVDISGHYIQYRIEDAQEDRERNWHEDCEDQRELMILLLLAAVLLLDRPLLSRRWTVGSRYLYTDRHNVLRYSKVSKYSQPLPRY